jgi:hypothetical protein
MATIFPRELTSAVRLSFVVGIIFARVGAVTGAESSGASSPPPPAFVQRGLPDQFQNALKPLAGEWRVEPTSTPVASETAKIKTMHFLVLLKVRPDATEEKQAPLRRSEAAAVWRLLSSGVLRSINFTSGPGAALEFEVEGETALRDYVDQLPMVSAGLVDVQILTLKPFTGLEALFDSLP